jgi:hypothetical protein
VSSVTAENVYRKNAYVLGISCESARGAMGQGESMRKGRRRVIRGEEPSAAEAELRCER